jgi:hypothetical protein
MMTLVTEYASDCEFWREILRGEPFGSAVRITGEGGKHNMTGRVRTAAVMDPRGSQVFAFDADTTDPNYARLQFEDEAMLMRQVQIPELFRIAMFVPDRERALAELAPADERERALREPVAWVEARVKAGDVEIFKEHPVVREVLEFFRAASGQADAA